MSSWSGGSFESRMNCEWIERQSRREEEEVGRVFAGWKETVAVVAIGGRGRGSGVRGLVEWPELDSTWTTYFYIAREIMGFPSWSGFPLGASGHRCTRQEILHHHPRRILSVSCSRPTFIVLVHPRSFTCLINPTYTPCHNLTCPPDFREITDTRQLVLYVENLHWFYLVWTFEKYVYRMVKKTDESRK